VPQAADPSVPNAIQVPANEDEESKETKGKDHGAKAVDPNAEEERSEAQQSDEGRDFDGRPVFLADNAVAQVLKSGARGLGEFDRPLGIRSALLHGLPQR